MEVKHGQVAVIKNVEKRGLIVTLACFMCYVFLGSTTLFIIYAKNVVPLNAI